MQKELAAEVAEDAQSYFSDRLLSCAKFVEPLVSRFVLMGKEISTPGKLQPCFPPGRIQTDHGAALLVVPLSETGKEAAAAITNPNPAALTINSLLCMSSFLISGSPRRLSFIGTSQVVHIVGVVRNLDGPGVT